MPPLSCVDRDTHNYNHHQLHKITFCRYPNSCLLVVCPLLVAHTYETVNLACSLTYILRASSHPPHPNFSQPSTSQAGSSSLHHATSYGSLYHSHTQGASIEENLIRTIINVVNRMISSPPPINLAGVSSSSVDSPFAKTKACFILRAY